MIPYPKPGMLVSMYKRGQPTYVLYGRIVTVIKLPGMGYMKGDVIVKKAATGDFVKVHRSWLYEYVPLPQHVLGALDATTD